MILPWVLSIAIPTFSFLCNKDCGMNRPDKTLVYMFEKLVKLLSNHTIGQWLFQYSTNLIHGSPAQKVLRGSPVTRWSLNWIEMTKFGKEWNREWSFWMHYFDASALKCIQKFNSWPRFIPHFKISTPFNIHLSTGSVPYCIQLFIKSNLFVNSKCKYLL